MQRSFLLTIIISVFSFSVYSQAPLALTKVVFIRHGEKPELGDNLSCTGFNRSLQLPGVLHKKFGVFNHVFVPSMKAGNYTTHCRMFQTIAPYLIKENISVSSKYDESDIEGISTAIRKEAGTVLIVWEHKNIHKIVKALGIKDDQKWDESDFDSIIILSYKNGVPTLSRDKEGITPGATCN